VRILTLYHTVAASFTLYNSVNYDLERLAAVGRNSQIYLGVERETKGKVLAIFHTHILHIITKLIYSAVSLSQLPTCASDT
jgi:hypothetical protein